MEGANKILIKIGSSIIIKDNKLDKEFLKKKVNEIASLVKDGKKVVLVTSGAVATGMEIENLTERPTDTVKLQLLSGKGQVRLMSKYIDYFRAHNVQVAQILLTHHNFLNKAEVNNLKDIINRYLDNGDVPIINANDVVTKEELSIDVFSTFSDNDQLATLVATCLGVDTLLILTDVDGLYDDNPNKNPAAKLIKDVINVSNKIIEMSKKGVSKEGLGGMYSKVTSAKKAMEEGITTIIANGKYDLRGILKKEVNCTIFHKKV